MSNTRVGVSNKGILVALVIGILLLGGGGGYLLWRVNQEDTVAPTDSDASEQVCVDRCTGPCTQNTPPFQAPDQCTDDAYKGCEGWASGVGVWKGCCLYERECNITAYHITYNAGANGSVSKAGKNSVAPGGSISSTATPSAGYKFVKWSDNKTTAARTDSNVRADATYTATFEALPVDKVTLTYTAGANGKITGTTPQTIDKGASGTAVTATPNTGYRFVKWSDNKTTAVRTDTNVQASATYTATFEILPAETVTLKYSVTPAGVGKIFNTDNAEITDKVLTINKGSIGKATARANSGYKFVKWNDNKTDNPRTDTINANTTFTATFEALPVDKVTLTYIAGAGGTITGTATQIINKGANGAAVTATPNTGYIFVQWSDNNTTATRADTNVQANATYTATFEASESCGDGICSSPETVSTCPEDCPAICGDSICSPSESNASCPADCTVPITGIFDNSKHTVIFGFVVLVIGLAWTWISTLPQKAFFAISSTSSKMKEESEKKRVERRRSRLERRLK